MDTSIININSINKIIKERRKEESSPGILETGFEIKTRGYLSQGRPLSHLTFFKTAVRSVSISTLSGILPTRFPLLPSSTLLFFFLSSHSLVFFYFFPSLLIISTIFRSKKIFLQNSIILVLPCTLHYLYFIVLVVKY